MNEPNPTRILEFDKVFTVPQANATLPLVKSIVRDLAALSQDLADRRQRLGYLTFERDSERQDPYSEELAEIEKELKKDEARFEEFLDELHAIQAIPREGPNGHFDEVDFPSMLDERPILLCWRLGEAEVAFWHEIDEDFDDRRPLSPTLAGSDQ